MTVINSIHWFTWSPVTRSCSTPPQSETTHHVWSRDDQASSDTWQYKNVETKSESTAAAFHWNWISPAHLESEAIHWVSLIWMRSSLQQFKDTDIYRKIKLNEFYWILIFFQSNIFQSGPIGRLEDHHVVEETAGVVAELLRLADRSQNLLGDTQERWVTNKTQNFFLLILNTDKWGDLNKIIWDHKNNDVMSVSVTLNNCKNYFSSNINECGLWFCLVIINIYRIIVQILSSTTWFLTRSVCQGDSAPATLFNTSKQSSVDSQTTVFQTQTLAMSNIAQDLGRSFFMTLEPKSQSSLRGDTVPVVVFAHGLIMWVGDFLPRQCRTGLRWL